MHSNLGNNSETPFKKKKNISARDFVFSKTKLLSFTGEKKIVFSDKQMLSEFTTTKPPL